MKAKILLLLIALAILFAGCTQQGEKIKVGAVLPFTGSSGITGESSRNGLDLALGEINSSGGINGK
ncbi:MAG: ABC transporter substrate-binding protein, partial [Candidatus ainarchaeum sp.]|nr:ABC transporter substrate-binding protein [Candidatus ainarchaeum sp.]